MVAMVSMLLLVVGACGTATSDSEQIESRASGAAAAEWCLAEWTGVTMAPPTSVAAGTEPSCGEPGTDTEQALAAVVQVMSPETFAGLWIENGQDIVIGYVGEPPALADLPGVATLVEREMSLAEMNQLAADRSADEEVGFRWEVDIATGTVVRNELRAIFVGDLIQDPTNCDTAIQRWLDEGASDPDFYIHLDNDGTAYWLVQCLDEDTGEQVIWRVTPDGAEPPDASNP